MEFQRRGVMLVIASPSGAGKSSISRSLFGQDPNIRLSVSVTTRARRTDEVEGTHYYFVDVPTFNRMKADGELLEWAQVHDNFYGTPRAKVEEQLAAGNDILFDVDYQGTLQLYEKSRKDMVTVFILPPTIKELRARLERAPRTASAPSKSGCATPSSKCSTIANTTTSSSMTTWKPRPKRSAPSSPPPAWRVRG